MTKLKLGAIPDDKPVRMTVELPATLHRDLLHYAELLASETGQAVLPEKLVAPMLSRCMATDRAFMRARRREAPTPELAGPLDAKRTGDEPRSTLREDGLLKTEPAAG